MSSIDKSFGDNVVAIGDYLTNDPMVKADADMRHVLNTLADLGGRPIESCLPAQARRQPKLTEAVKQVLAPAGRDLADDMGITTEDVSIPGPIGEIAARLYRPAALEGESKLPMILYLHGGGWVLGDLDSADPVPRILAKRTGAIVVSAHYRLGPEHKFPAAHEDSYAAWLWMLEEAEALGGDASRAAVVGEDAGGNMALNIALQARDEAMPMPVHQALIYPIVGNDMTRESYLEAMRAQPLNTPMMQWFTRHAFEARGDTADPRINLVERQDFSGLPPVTLILAELDPLRTEGEVLAQALHEQGVWVDAKTYEGVGHDFFGLGSIVTKALFAQSQVINTLNEAFSTDKRSS
ncbi:MAG TPA: alpha/beta hydrolase [Devosiaceae bacterium]|jgi:acetyl esterase/lipase